MTDFFIRALDRCAASLWRKSFGDSDAFVSRSINILSESAKLATLEEDGVILSQCILIEHSIYIDRALYIYAACTHPEQRGKGLFSRLLDEVTLYASQEGFALLSLIPAGDRLSKYYESRGFTFELPLSASFDPNTPEDFYLTLDACKYSILPY